MVVFENMSTYPDEWAKGIFKRFFVFLEYLKETGGRECIVLDSDVLIYQDYSELFDFSDIDVAIELPSNQKMEMLPYNNDYRWVACAGVSYFKTEALEDFLDFCIETYKNNKGLLNEKWEIHRKYGLPGGVCEMSLLYLWQKSRDQMKILNLSKPFQGILPCVVVNQNCSEYTGQVYKMERLTGNKCIYINFKDHVPYIQYEEADFRSQDGGGEDFRVSALHFVGNSKIFMNGLRKKQMYTMLSLSEYSYWRLRNRLSKIKSRFKAKK